MLEFIICLTADGAAAVETLRAELAQAKEQARISNTAAEKAVGELKAEQAAHRLSEEKISNMALELRDAASQYALLEKETKEKTADLEKALQAAKETRSEARAAREEIRQAGEIAAGKPFLLRTKFGDPKYAPLDQMWSSPDAYLDLSKSASDATQFFRAQEGHEAERLFWSQFSMPRRPLLLNEQMAEWAELHRISGLAMKAVVDRLWPGGPTANSYFGLVQQLVCVVSHIDAVKRSTCIEGARMALARVKTCWAKMKATDIAIGGPPKGQDTLDRYFEEVLEGARLIEGQCSKNIMFE